MISVLIPVYNYNVSNLVIELNKQLINEKIEFEIICIDDSSTEQIEENLQLNKLNNVQFIQLAKNIGRSKIRNILAKKATFNWLLFLDADVMPELNTFTSCYLSAIKEYKSTVFCGGIVYQLTPPGKNKMLRWVYGRKREEIDFFIRNKKPYDFFLGSNFLIYKEVFNKFIFNESIVKYGYEDVVFAQKLRDNSVAVEQINNRVFHLGLEYNSVYLEKVKEALRNLRCLDKQGIVNENFIRILKRFNFLKRYKLVWFFSIIWSLFYKILEYNLKSGKPSIFLFDIYRLTYLCSIDMVK